MTIKENINKYALWIVLFLSFIGFYIIVLTAINNGMSSITRKLTIPTRALIGLCCMTLFIINVKQKRPFINLFLSFVIIYLFRVLYDVIHNEFFYINYSDLLFYFLSFSAVPFISLSKVDFSRINFNKLYSVFLISAIAFGVLVNMFYAKFVGEVARISTDSAGEDVVNPLILSYSATLVIGVVTLFLINNKPKAKIKILSYVAITMSIIPFFLGASRGSILALFLPFIFLIVTNISIKNIFNYFLLSVFIIIIITYFDNYLGSGLLDRFTNIGNDIESGSSSAIRLQYWMTSLNQFLDNPLIGDKLQTDGLHIYPHNILLEVLQSIGILGFIPFILLILQGFKASWRIFKYNKSYSWVTVFFLQAFMQNMFSGAVYTAAWFWTGLAIVLSIDYSIIRYGK